MATLNIQAPDTPADDLSVSLMEHGHIVVPDLARQVMEELKPHIEAAPFGVNAF
uniref:Uncharacterized protein n=1 Tax=uncultured alpha proteobacterium EF100_94H03 TaxID=710800 RepID=E0Y1Z5_9PROT|nr:hypothetical protein [uncultured alpha proteobacterium EF100_94H03]